MRPGLDVQDTGAQGRRLQHRNEVLVLPTDLPKDIRHRQDGSTQETGAFLTPPHLSMAARMSGSVPCGFGSFPTIASSPGLLLPLPGITARRAVTSERATQGQLCLVTARSERELITYLPKGGSVTPKTSCRKTRAGGGAGRAAAGRRGERGTARFAITPDRKSVV